MPSRNIFLPIQEKKPVTAEDVNILYNLINGYFDNKRGHGAPVKFTAFDGRYSDGRVDTTSAALDVRNRETTQQRTAIFRRADGNIVAEVRAGLLRAVDTNASSPTLNSPVMVYGTPAGGVLTDTYPNPNFAAGLEYHRFRPKMIMPFTGSNATVSLGGNLEVVECPGWVFCDGAFVTMRDNTIFQTPDLNNRMPIGAGTVGLKAQQGVAYNSLVGLSVEHVHAMPHNHPHDHAHEHTVSAHTHTMAHSHTVPFGHTHGVTDHVHTIPDHSHNMGSHTHVGGTLTWVHRHNHSHGMNGHTHGLSDHDHESGSLALVNKDTGVAKGGILYDEDQAGSGEFTRDFAHTHELVDSDVNGITATGQLAGTSTNFNVTGGPSLSGTELDNTNPTSADPWSGASGLASPTDTAASALGTAGSTTLLATTSQSTSSSTVNFLSTDGNVGDGPAVSTTAKTASIVTTPNDTTNTSGASVTTIDVRPPVTGVYWIFKL